MKVYDCLTPELQGWIRQQKMFFVATAPRVSAANDPTRSHVNVSPKGYDCFAILNDHTVCYMDMTGSGNETSAHIAENGRITIMFCALTGPPRILRLYGKGQVVLRDTPAFDELVQRTGLTVLPAARQVIVNHIHKVTTSCGYGVPKFDYVKDRSTLQEFANGKSDAQMIQYRKENNLKSLDGIVTPLGEKYGLKNEATTTAFVNRLQDWPYYLVVTATLVIAVGIAMTTIVANPTVV